MDFSDWIVTIEATGSGADHDLMEHLVNTLASAEATGGDGIEDLAAGSTG